MMANVSGSGSNKKIQDKSQKTSDDDPPEKQLCTLKRNPKVEFSKTDLLNLLSHLEGELQARDIVIAALKSERVKQHLVQSRQLSVQDNNDPLAALQRDSFAVMETSNRDNTEMVLLVNQQLNSLDNLVTQHRRAQARVGKLLQDAQTRHRKEIEIEKQSKKKFEREYMRLAELLDYENNRHKQVVLFLLAERKQIIMKYVEERKRSEDLAQILTEEKGRTDAMAEGLEEESKKKLQMEAELEKQLAQFYVETQHLKLNIANQEKKNRELDLELEKARKEATLLRQQLLDIKTRQHQEKSSNSIMSSGDGTSLVSSVVPSPQCAAPMIMTNVAKVVQPTATVSSVPVSGPMTGIARSVSPGQHIRQVMYSNVPNTQVNSGIMMTIPTTLTKVQEEKRTVVASPTMRSATVSSAPYIKMSASSIARGAGSSPITTGTNKKPIPIGRGVPPPIPPNKPAVPPKKDGIFGRKPDLVSDIVSKGCLTPNRPTATPAKIKISNLIDKPNADENVRNEADNSG